MTFRNFLMLGAAALAPTVAVAGIAALPVAAFAQDSEPDDAPEIDARIMDEGLNRSEVQMLAHELVDGIGARLTNSPNMRKAESWAVDKMRDLGLKNVRKEGFEFGRGWEHLASSATMLTPREVELTATPVAWTPGTNGVIEAEVVVAPISERAHFEAYRGQLAGKIVMISIPGMGDEPTRAPFRRLDSSDISSRNDVDLPNYSGEGESVERSLKRRKFALELDEFLAAEGAVAWAKMSYRDGKLLHGTGYTHHVGMSPKLPGIEIAAEDYRRIARFAKTGPAPRLRIENDVRFVDGDTQAYNIIGEMAGSDPSAGYVMAGAHFDSWYTGDGAVDNGSGSVVVLEAARILKALGVKPKRTIKFALWGAEEQGLLGSLAYARRHLVSRAGENDLSAFELSSRWRDLYPVTAKPGYSDFKAYFNMDNGSGKFRGLHAEGNPAAEPYLRSWLSSYGVLDAGRVVSGSTGGTDHVYFQAVGLPGYQFIQDPLDYFARLHHTNVDTFDHLRPDDLRQAATVMAGVLLAAANDKGSIPKMPLPVRPNVTDPFEYEYPETD
ncbi:Aminopeptidase Y [Alteripontixanthobacter maritimus]|uniref:Carboxypeptidase Q n=1 Tax=Alteripontixanthobacter maritimus TaxID=2161824 RepID=A0A369Q4R7_9SPHN|nr:M20/M25/M40 family metallo-hydrolase [Alteripontixanthobacter maritimus]RDC59891.1 Aminopeptidase Y [Alteripontixanthobacter maritimus]